MKSTNLALTFLIVLALLSFSLCAFAQGDGAGAQAAPAQGKQLTDEQRTQLQAKMKEMKQAGTKREEIRATVQEMLKGWGVEAPTRKGGGQNGRGGAMKQLTDEQRTQVANKMQEMKDAGAKPEDIRAAMQEMLKGFGITAPQGKGGRGAGQGGRQAPLQQLTEEQRTQLQAKVKGMREAGAKPEEIKAAMAEMLKGWGIEAPQGARGLGAGGRQGMMQKLTDEQRKEVQTKLQDMRKAGAKPEEIRATMQEMLKGWGIEAPQGAGKGLGGGGRQGMMKQLTDEQRQQVKTKVQELKQAGAKPEEIRAAIAEFIKNLADQNK